MECESFDWLKPSPLWQSDGSDLRQASFFRPQFFEYRTDQFMEEFLAAVAAKSSRRLAAAASQDTQLLKMFQPVHGSFYLAAASLCCRVAGFPDRVVDADAGESAFFVLRKLLAGVEYAWLEQGDQNGWVAVNGSARTVLKGEQRLPLFSAAGETGRLLRFGYIPVSSSQTYSVPPAELAVDGVLTDIRIEELGSRFTAPLTRPAPPALSVIATLPDGPALTVSVYLLLDLWEYLDAQLPDVAAALRDDPAATFSGDKAQQKSDLLAFLAGVSLQGGLTLSAALQNAAKKRAALNQTGGGDLAQLGFTSDYNLKHAAALDNQALLDLIEKVRQALPSNLPPLVLPKLDQDADTRYAVRFIYERPQCDPPVQCVSQPSQLFQFASFFDPDAPARVVRIPLPADISIAGLRKFKKGVTFMMSDAMRKKMGSLLGKETTLLSDNPELNPEDAGGFAFICSFSIQIIFIVAFMLLLIFVVVFNIIFFWLAFFKICLPVPKKLLPG